MLLCTRIPPFLGLRTTYLQGTLNSSAYIITVVSSILTSDRLDLHIYSYQSTSTHSSIIIVDPCICRDLQYPCLIPGCGSPSDFHLLHIVSCPISNYPPTIQQISSFNCTCLVDQSQLPSSRIKEETRIASKKKSFSIFTGTHCNPKQKLIAAVISTGPGISWIVTLHIAVYRTGACISLSIPLTDIICLKSGTKKKAQK